VNEGVRLRRRRRSALDALRRNPVKHGLVGLAVAGTAGPLAVARFNQARVNPAHEQQAGIMPKVVPISDQAVGEAWRAAQNEVASNQASTREETIQGKLDRYGEMGLTRALAEQIYDNAVRANIDPEIAFGLVRTESEFKSSATSHVGAVGLTQLMPATARWMRAGTTVADLREPGVNLSIGFKYLRQLLDKYEGDSKNALLAYNRGPGIVDRILKRGGDPDNGYAQAVISGEGVH
jgi:soluble lytic murein transglycosylase-like protein